MTTNAELLERHQAVLPSWLALYYDPPISMDHGEGRHVVDVEGNCYLDFFGGILTTSLGYDIPEVTRAIQEQAPRVLHSSTLYLSEPMVELAELVADLSGIPDARVFFTTSGTEANDAALLLATCYRRSNQILALRNSYHGRSFSTIAITSQRSWSPTSLSGLSVNYVQGGYRMRSPFRHLDDDAYTEACVDDLVQVFDMMTSGDVAAMVAEPIQGVGGFAVPPDGFFGAMKKELDNRGVLFISDEVQTGWGRTGDHFWGYQAHGVVPDMLTFAKGVGNGLSLGGVVARADVMDCLPANSLSTFGGNPLSSAGALATIRYMLDNDTQGNASRMGSRLEGHLRGAADAASGVGELRGRGLMRALEMVRPGTDEPDPDAAAGLMEATRARGLLIGKGGLYGNVLRIAPPLTVTADEVDEGGRIIAEALRSLDTEAG